MDGAASEDAGDGTVPADTSARQFLRAVTRPWHDAVEAAFAPFDLATASGLRGFLLRQAAAVLPAEAAVERAGIGALVPDWHLRRRTAALAADLRTLGVVDPQVPVPGPMPPMPSAAHAMGSLYVLEGSKLGGHVLARRVLASPDPLVRAACRFLGHRHPGGWARFVAILEDCPASPGWRAALRAGAEDTFALFRLAASGADREPAEVPSVSPLVHLTHA